MCSECFDYQSVPSCEKNATPLVLSVLFIYTIFKEDNAPVICIHGPHLRG